ncbi:MAG: mtsF, partial [Myxococcaceae bacterium]|nr:mtsF [Myxococcaceae bacterium]
MAATRWMGWALVVAVALAGCGPAVDEEEEELPGGPPPPDACSTRDDAIQKPECQLTLGTPREELIGLPSDVDYFSVKMPGGLTARSLLHISAGYGVPSTPVNLALVVTTEAEAAVAMGIDKHGAAAPKPIELIEKFSVSDARLLVILRDDQNGKHFDYRSPYFLKIEVVDDPDVNEPNDTTPTLLPLVAQADRLVGSQTGYLSTRDDVDRFKFTVPPGKGVLHLRVTAPKLMPAPPFRVAFALLNAAGTTVAEGHALNEYVPIDLATARAATAGDYVLEVKGYKTQALQSLPGDLRLQYKIDAQVLTELDSNEPNNALEAAKTQTLSAPGQSTTIRGRIGQVGDPDWFGFDLPALSRPTVLHYKLTPGSAAGRFPVLPGPLDRQVRIFSEVKDGATLIDRQNNCRTKPAICPRREDAPNDQLGLADAYCGLTPPRCMWSAREEHSKFSELRNFEGAVPIAAHGGTTRYFVVVEDEGNNWADDREYTLTVTWRDDADEAGRMSGTTEQTPSRTIAVDSSGSGFPSPPSGGAFELSGRLSYGYGYWRNNDAMRGEGIR